MKKALYFILFLSVILSQGFCNLPEENNGKSSDIHIRQKRIAGGQRQPAEDARYLVHLLNNENYHCPATLLTNNVAVTSAECCKTRFRPRFFIQSLAMSGQLLHQVQDVIFLDPNYNASHPTIKNLALLRFAPAIQFHVSSNRPISIYSGNVVDQSLRFKVFTWARPFSNGIRRVPATHLRSLSVNLISIHYCQDFYPGLIGFGNLCTYATKIGEHCDDTDSGSPLVVEDHLIGIMVFHGHVATPNPDVFMNFLDHDIRRWIHQHVPSLRLF